MFAKDRHSYCCGESGEASVYPRMRSYIKQIKKVQTAETISILWYHTIRYFIIAERPTHKIIVLETPDSEKAGPGSAQRPSQIKPLDLSNREQPVQSVDSSTLRPRKYHRSINLTVSNRERCLKIFSPDNFPWSI